MFFPPTNYRSSASDDDLASIPSSRWFPKWIGGIVIPLFFVVYAVVCWITRHGLLPGENTTPLNLYGKDAVALGVVSASVGVLLHCHFFWGNIYHLSAWAVLGKIVSLMAFVGSLVYLIVHIVFWG
jgi:hypothetical protein